MANIQQAKKRARQYLKRKAFNRANLSKVRNGIKKFLNILSLEKNNNDLIKICYTNAISLIDKSVHKGIFHKNKAGRIKSKLSNKFKTGM